MLAKCRSTVNKMWNVAETLQDMGINKHISFIAEDGDVRHAMKAEILMILLAIIGEVPDQAQVKFLQYVLHAPIDEENKEEYFESVSRIGQEHYNTLLPYFCVIDKYINTKLAETYLNFMAAIVIGCMKYSDTLNIALLQRYFSITTRGKKLIDRWLQKKIDFEPLDFWKDDTRRAVEQMCKRQAQQSEVNELCHAIMKVLGKEIQDVGKKTAFEEYIKSLNPRLLEIPKEQNDEVDKDVPLEIEEDDAISIEEAKAELDHMVGLEEVKWQVTSMMNIAKIR